eukprot:SAG11_NODE_165_length_13834_cov_72.998544_11_plen_71_part_00
MFSRKRPVFEAFKNKTYLKCSGARIKMIMAKKTNESKVIAREIGELLKGGSRKHSILQNDATNSSSRDLD